MGEELHTIMDITAPAHRNEKGEPQEYGITKAYDHHNKEDPDGIIKNDGKNGYITLDTVNMKFEFAQYYMRLALQGAVDRREAYLKKQEDKKRDEKNKETLQQQREKRGSILQTYVK